MKLDGHLKRCEILSRILRPRAQLLARSIRTDVIGAKLRYAVISEDVQTGEVAQRRSGLHPVWVREQQPESRNRFVSFGQLCRIVIHEYQRGGINVEVGRYRRQV